MIDFDTVLDVLRAILILGRLPTKIYYKKLLQFFPTKNYYHNIVSMEITSPQEKLSPLFWQSASKKIPAHQDAHLVAFL